jgi:quinol monooxygenase YgiN
MIVVVGELSVGRQHVEAVQPHMLAMMAASRAEPGCLRFAYMQDRDRAHHFYVCEAWTTTGTLRKHRDRPHRRDWRRVWPRYGVTLHHLEELPLKVPRGVVLLGAGAAFTAGTYTAVTEHHGVYATHCLTHGRSRSHEFKATAIDGAEHPGEWCPACRLLAPPPGSVRAVPGGPSKAAIVTAVFEVPPGVDETTDYSDGPPSSRPPPRARLRSVG